MSDNQSYELLGFDNVVLPVGDVGAAVAFYERAGFTVGFRLDEAGIALLKVGTEAPGLLLRHEEGVGYRPPPWPSPRVWLEVPDARAVTERLTSAGIPPLEPPFAVATGWTVEIGDPWGNVIGFTDYSKRPELGRGAGVKRVTEETEETEAVEAVEERMKEVTEVTGAARA